jgi:membrane protease YdiL (CAAX protease family)
MTTIMAFITRHPVTTFYATAFVISQGGVLLVAVPGGIPGPPERTAQIFPLALLAWLAGIGVTGLLVTGLVHGRAGLRALLARLLRWRVSTRWYAAALLTAPLAYLAVLLVLSRFSSAFVPRIVADDSKVSALLAAVAMGLAGGSLEEIGWTGFAIPGLLRRHGVLATGLIAGALWGVWHIPITYWTTGDPASVWPSSPALFLLVYLVGGVGGLTAYRMLMVWVYDRTGSVLLATLMHASLIVCNIYLLAPALTGPAYWAWSFATSVALWLLVAAVAAANRGQLARRPAVGAAA